MEDEKKMLTSISNCNFEMNIDIASTAEMLASAMEEQAIANALNSKAMLTLALALKPIEICAIKIMPEGIDLVNKFKDPTIDDLEV